MVIRKLGGFASIVFMGMMGACTSTPPFSAQQSLKTFSSDQIYGKTEKPKCKALLDNYCKYLYAPGILGNLEVRQGEKSILVLQGETKNDFSQVYYSYALAKMRNKHNLPRDFSQALKRLNYFKKMESFLSRKPRVRMTQSQRFASDQLDSELAFIWSAAINETILSRMLGQYPEFYRIPEKLIPIELQLERRRLRRNLISDISNAIWRNNKNWSKVEEGFSALKDSYFRVLDKLDISELIKNDWKKRIAEVKLVLPGALPAISNEECSTTTINAYYYTYLNVITVCAGDFNSEDIIQTLAHEMGHVLGVDRSQYLFETHSKFGKGLKEFRAKVCKPESFSCNDWNEYKKSFDSDLTSLGEYQTELPEFQRCLKRRKTSKALTDSDIERFSISIISDRISDLASSDRFLRITKAEIPMINGKNQKNPNYFNPCAYYLWSQGEEPIDDELTTLIYFTAEYRCSDHTGSEKIKNAIEVSKNMSSALVSRTLVIEGEFSARSLLEVEGFSSPPYERFADVIGSYAMAELLTKLPSQRDRQNKFLASSSWQCLQPSLASHFPDESAVEKEYIFDSHTEGDQRRRELFSLPIRESIGCEQDFEFKECQLPFREAVN